MRSFDEWFDENCDGSDLAKDACRKLWDEFSDQINIICRKSYEKQQSKVDELKLQVAEMKSRLNDAYTDGQSAMYAARQSKVDELQKRVDAAKYYMKNIFSGDAEVDQCHLGDLLDILDGKIVDEIEQALKGVDQNTEKQPNKHAENIAIKVITNSTKT